MKFYFDESVCKVQNEIAFIIKTFAKNKKIEVEFSADPVNAIRIGGKECDIKISKSFIDKTFSNRQLNKDCHFEYEDGSPDYISTSFYMLNSLQEYDNIDLDSLGRFKFKNSYQFRFGNATQNIVQDCFDKISEQLGLSISYQTSSFFLSHDIDLVNGALLEDGYYALKKGRIDLLLKFFYHTAIGRPDWLNMDKIVTLESEHDCRSMFFWIVNKGKINEREKNADYRFQSSVIQKHFKNIDSNKFENGIHKSISNETFNQEIAKYGQQPIANRYHYLKFNLPKGYNDIADGNLKIDASLGFAEEIGFRNNYGLPFNPFNFNTQQPYSFVEVPLHIMDRTYFQYKKWNVELAEREILNFFENHKMNCVISILWHNNFFSNYKYKGYLSLYKKILCFIRDNNFKTISQQEIINRFSIV